MALEKLTRAAAWLLLAGIVVLSVVPAMVRPTTAMPHNLEHASIFLLDGLAFGAVYLGHERWLTAAAAAFCGGVELAQLMVPGRHARVSDFVVDTLAAAVGIFAGSLLVRMTTRRLESSR